MYVQHDVLFYVYTVEWPSHLTNALPRMLVSFSLLVCVCVCVCVCVLWEHLEIYPQAGGVAQTVRVQGPQFKFQCAKKKERKKEIYSLSNFQVHNTSLLTVVTMMYITFLSSLTKSG
jgi:hypothetical protein